MAGAAASAPEAGSDSPRWVPIDALLATAAGDLRSGELVHVAGFSLFHSMNALQIMDPKMDVGVNAASLRTARELVSLGRAPLDLSDEDATYVFDALLACEATWHRGQALATTVHTCLYVHDRERLEAAPSLVVRAYLEATRSAVATVRHAVQCGDIYEEEDFVISANGFDVGEPASADVGGDDGAARRANDVGPAASSAATKDAALAARRRLGSSKTPASSTERARSSRACASASRFTSRTRGSSARRRTTPSPPSPPPPTRRARRSRRRSTSRRCARR